MSDKDISKMDFKELRNEVQELRDELARAKRYFGDLLEHLDYDNFSSRVVKDKNGMETSIKQTAEAITLQAKDIKELSTSMSELKITAGEISATVSENYEDLDRKITSNTAKISVAADEILQTVSETYQTLDAATQSEWELQSQISQTADSISSIVSKNISAYFNSEIAPNKMSNVTDAQKAMLCLYDEVYYYFSDINKEWVEYPAGGLKTMFKQAADGFELTGDVQISGDAVVGGTISGTRISDSSNSYYVEMSNANDYGAFRLYDNGIDNGAPIFSIWDNKTGGIGLMSNGTSFLLASNVGNEPFASPQGNWNFSNCTITNWGNNAPVAVFG